MKKLILSFVFLSLLVPAVYLVFAQEARPKAKNTRVQDATKPIVDRVPPDKTLGETQFFCGYCHVLTYPEIMKRAHKTWKEDKGKDGKGGHNEVGCVECHYPPDLPAIPEHRKIPRSKAAADKKKKTDMEFMKTELEVFSKLVTLLNMDESTVLRRPKIDDRSCTTSDCHPTDRPKKKEGEYWAKKVKFTEYERVTNGKKEKVPVYFTHKEHYDKKKWIEGQEMHCVTCHRKETPNKHFEVSKESCYLCHFKNAEDQKGIDKRDAFIKGRAACSHCHKLPEKPFKEAEKPDEKPVTHKDLEERKVSCTSCHLELVKGNGEVRVERCLDCHENDKKIMKDAKNKKVMHKEHVAKQTAACLNCHEPILHKGNIKDYTYVDAALSNCRVCHEEPHKHQALLLAGKGAVGIPKEYPIKHHEVKTNCIACHTKAAKDEKGRKIKAADDKACVDCHNKEAGEQMEKWKKDMSTALQDALAAEKDAIEALEKAKGKVPEKELQQAVSLIKKGQENLRLVDAGGGVHNKKFATLVLDAAIADFDEAIALLKPKK